MIDLVEEAFAKFWAEDLKTRNECEAMIARYGRFFRAGAAFAAEQQAGNEREGSDLAGRAIYLFRPMYENEIARENPAITHLNWPCLQLNDGTLVYAAKTGPDGEPVPAKLYGYQPGLDRKVRFTVSTLMQVRGEQEAGE